MGDLKSIMLTFGSPSFLQKEYIINETIIALSNHFIPTLLYSST